MTALVILDVLFVSYHRSVNRIVVCLMFVSEVEISIPFLSNTELA
jgi:hypothetical protein